MEAVKTEIKQLRHTRGIIKAKLTRFENFLNVEENKNNVAQLETRLLDIEKDFDNFNTIQSQLEFLDESEVDEREQIESTFYFIRSTAKQCIQTQLNITSNIEAVNIRGVAKTQGSNDNFTKLPDIGLPSFFGTYDTWLSFYDIFKSVVHDRQDLSDIQKFLYLKICCKQDALRQIESLEVRADNYKVALELLKKRFENKRAIINHHVNSLLFKLPEVTKESHVSLRKLLDSVLQHMSALTKLNLPTEHWDALLIPLILRKLDDNTKREWENKQEENVIPTLQRLTKFLEKKCFTLEAIYTDSQKGYVSNKPNRETNVKKSSTTNYLSSNSNSSRYVQPVYAVSQKGSYPTCVFCNNSHYISFCPEFTKLSIDDRYKEVKKLKLCSNCLRSGHFRTQCNSSLCKKCSLKHHTLLHHDNYQFNKVSLNNQNNNDNAKISQTRENVSETQAVTAVNNNQTEQSQSNIGPQVAQASYHVTSTSKNINNSVAVTDTIQHYETSMTSCKNNNKAHQVLLSTATILIDDHYGNSHECTALLDSGSSSNLISQQLCDKLNLMCQDFHIPIAGINQNVTNIKQKTTAIIRSRFNSFSSKLTFLILPVITEKLPLIAFDDKAFSYPNSINIADKEFNVPKRIDVLLGANIFYELLCTGKIWLGKNMPVLQETRFGWIFTGTVNSSENLPQKNECYFTTEITNEQLNDNLIKFWQIEEVPNKQRISCEAKRCEDIFKLTTERDNNGRFIVKLPFIENMSQKLGDSKSTALKRFYGIETRLRNDANLKRDYLDFMNEYEQLNHMTPKSILENDNSPENNSYFLPHHPVIRQGSTTTKCRVVFDASAKTNTDISLNDLLLIGAPVQDELFSIVLRLRLRRYVLNADIKMMYRQILVHPDDRKHQKILWRYDEKEPVKIYELNTVTYGTASAPFLATRCLQQLAFENENYYPRTCNIIKNSFYMDDLLVSLDLIEEALEVYHEITEILSTAGFQLRKWSSNNKSILVAILRGRSNDDKLVLIHDSKELKTLGIAWDSNSDTLSYTVNAATNNTQFTKRSVLSILSQIFDPLGLIGPAVIKAKLLMQRLWQLRVEWDEPIPEEFKISWLTFLSQIHSLNSISIERNVLCKAPTQVELHGFSDSSERAYGACIYLCSVDAKGQRHSNLLCAKSRVAPLKKITLPRLELLAANLLAKLAHTVLQTLDLSICKQVFYSDSTIVLAWLKIEPSQLKTFVANRVVEITELTKIDDWKHVKSEQNPADIISRGINPTELGELKIWWHGPNFLIEHTREFDSHSELKNAQMKFIPDLKNSQVSLSLVQKADFNIFDKYSTLNKLQRVVAYIYRFTKRTRYKEVAISNTLTVDELQQALLWLIRLAQRDVFSQEINALKKSQKVLSNSKILSLHPFLDPQGILRVGGRLSHSQLNFDQKHPIILSDKHKLTHLIIEKEHSKHLHAGVQNLLSIIRLHFWPINGKNLIKRIIRSCIKCFRTKPKPAEFLMGELPSARVIPSRPFSRCGVDYAGPILVKEGTLRKAKVVKTYICIFICFAVRAVHIELVRDLTTDSFLNALKRFIARRGKPRDIFSDNGLNFVGANNHFIELSNILSNQGHHETVSNFLAKDKITWHFIPPKSPHVGGLWEAAVKSMKFHLRRILGNASVSYEETYTILTQIESCLNSRPLTSLSSDPDDYLPLTPSHFLIGDSLASAPQIDVQNININRLTRYQRMQQLVQQFWRRWYREYLCQLQQRSKWKGTSNSSLKIGSLVILVEDNMPLLHWPMARIIELHPGADGEVRVVTVKVSNGSKFKRSLKKICILPIVDDNDNCI